MPHFFVAPFGGDEVELTGEDAHHLVRVLRAQPGDRLTLADNSGVIASAVLRSVSPAVRASASEPVSGDIHVRARVTARRELPAPRPALTVVQALPKGRKLDQVVQRLTELGVERIVAVHSARSQVRLDGERAEKALRRWRAVALAAAKQSRRARLPEIVGIGEWEEAFSQVSDGVVLWEEARDSLRAALSGFDADELVLAVGPEGGLTTEEVATTDLPAASLGPTILRTETAALVGAAVVMTLTGRME
ncbi:MAG: RsmE family RNA methyltransferase [Egibacteraceae bacterium]